MKLFTKKLIAAFFIGAFLMSAIDAMSQCAFRPNQRYGCQGSFSYNLTDISTGVHSTSTNWVITFMNSRDTIIQNNYFQASFVAPVCGHMKVEMTDSVGCHIIDTNFAVYCNPVLRGAFNNTVSCANACIEWLDSSVAHGSRDTGCTGNPNHISYLIDWGGGALDTQSNICHHFGNDGLYSPSIVITNSCGCRADTTFVNAINITAPPTASFTGTNRTSCVSPLVSVMTATANGQHTKYYWYIDSGTGYMLIQANGSNIFSYPYTTGTWSIKLVTRDSTTQCADSTIQPNYVTAGSHAAACFTANVTSGCAPAQITLMPCTPVSAAGPTSFHWIANGSTGLTNNGVYGTNQTVLLLYSSAGRYDVSLIVQYQGGCTDTQTRVNYISLGNRVTLCANLHTLSDSVTCHLPDTFCVDYCGQACAGCAFSWSPYNGTTPYTNTTPFSHTGTCYIVNSYGQYSYSLNVTDPFGCSQSLIQTNAVTVGLLSMTATATPKHRSLCANDTILLTYSSSIPLSSYSDSFPGASYRNHYGNTVELVYPAAGCHKYMLIGHTSSGCIDTLRDSICTLTKPNVSLTINPRVYCYQYDSTCFTVTVNGTDTPGTYVRVWPEGLSALHVDITKRYYDSCFAYIYPDYGDFAVCFVANNRGCLGDTICLTAPTDSVHIFPPAPCFRTQVLCNNRDSLLYINCSKGADSIIWHVCGGQTFTNVDSVYVPFPQCGVFCPVTLTAFNDSFNRPAGCHVTKIDSLASVPCYGVNFKVPRTGCYNNYRNEVNIVYTDSTSYRARSVVWDFPHSYDLNHPLFTPPIYIGDTLPLIRLNDTALYDVYIQLTYPNGCIDTLKALNYIDISGPIAGFRSSNVAGCIPFCVQFNDTSTYHFASRKSFVWDFGDNTRDSTNSNPNHCFNTVGQFNVTLTVVDSNGCTQQSTVQIQSNQINAALTASSPITCTTSPDPRNPITFTDASTGFVSSRTYSWTVLSGHGTLASINPSNPGNVPSFNAQFTDTGTYMLTMIVTDQYNICRDTASVTVRVANPHADYTFANLQDTFRICPPAIINPFIDLSSNDICTYAWDYGDGSPIDTTRSPGHIYTIPGECFPITHWVYSCHGCVDSITKYQICMDGPVIHVRASKSAGCAPFTVCYYITSWNTDSFEFTSGGGSLPLFVDRAVSPRGTRTNPHIDTICFNYNTHVLAYPSVTAFDKNTFCSVTSQHVDTVQIDSPVVNYTYAVTPCSTDVCFTNTTTHYTSLVYDSVFSWNFGDGITSAQPNPCHTYSAPGHYNVSFTVLSNYGCSDTIVKDVYVVLPPKVKYQISDSIGCTPFTVLFTDSSFVDDSTTINLALSYWDFGNGVTAGYANTISYRYQGAGGLFMTKLVITDGNGCRDSATRLITVFGPPQDSARSRHDIICLGSTDTLHVVSNSAILWLDNYNIDTVGRSYDPVVSPTVDTFYIFRLGDFPGCYVYDTIYVKVSTVTVSSSAISGLCLGGPTTLSGTATTIYSSINSATGYVWNFGDGSATATGQTVSHIYSPFGIYYDTLTVTNRLGCKGYGYDTIRISDRPHAHFTLSDTSACLGKSITLTDSSQAGTSAGLDSFFWEMPLGTRVDSSSPFVYTGTMPGVQTVYLIQTDSSHCADTTHLDIYIRALPHASMTVDSNCINQPNTFTSTSTQGTGAINYYNWVINGLNSPPVDSSLGVNSPTVQHTFVDSGYYQVSLAVHDIYGCSDTVTDLVHILAKPVDMVTPQDTTICAGYSAAFNISGPQFDRVHWVPSTWVNNPDSPNVVITPRQTISYQVFSYYRTCAPKIDTVNIWVIDSVPVSATANPTNIILGLSSNISSDIKGTIDRIVWSPDSTLNCSDCFNPVATPSQTTTYTATIYYSRIDTVKNDTFTCTNTATVTINVYQNCDGKLIYVPNTFTPNNDDRNDMFRLRGQGIIHVNYFRVYDRWGKLVYDATNVANVEDAAWNGGYLNNLDNLENTGVYVYLFEVECTTHEIVKGKGNVTLIR